MYSKLFNRRIHDHGVLYLFSSILVLHMETISHYFIFVLGLVFLPHESLHCQRRSNVL